MKKIQDKKKIIKAKAEQDKADRRAAGLLAENEATHNLLDEGDEDLLF